MILRPNRKEIRILKNLEVTGLRNSTKTMTRALVTKPNSCIIIETSGHVRRLAGRDASRLSVL